MKDVNDRIGIEPNTMISQAVAQLSMTEVNREHLVHQTDLASVRQEAPGG